MLLDIIKQIVAKEGEKILSEPRRVSAFFMDLAKDEPKPQKLAFVKCLEHEFAKILKDVAEKELPNCKESLAKKLNSEEGLELKLCKEAVDMLCAALFEEREKPKTNRLAEEIKKLPRASLETFLLHILEDRTLLRKKVSELTAEIESLKPTAPKSFCDDKTGIDMVFVEGGTFTMGATAEQGGDSYDNEKPAHSVTLSDFYIGKYEVTQKQWVQVMGSNPSNFKGDDLPVEQVSWEDIQGFLSKLRQITGKSYRLLTEAEWEYAARGGSKSRGYKYSGSNNIGEVAWYYENSGDNVLDDKSWASDKAVSNKNSTHPVCQKLPNELNICDMSGNVWELVSDWHGDYSSGSQTNPTGPSSGRYRVIRGGSWYNDARDCRVSNRGNFGPSLRDYNLGFRLALSL
jgi:formylglycine-generating enzyme required for sulfatase activity